MSKCGVGAQGPDGVRITCPRNAEIRIGVVVIGGVDQFTLQVRDDQFVGMFETCNYHANDGLKKAINDMRGVPRTTVELI